MNLAAEAHVGVFVGPTYAFPNTRLPAEKTGMVC